METFDVKTERSYDQSLRNLEQFLISQYQAGTIPVLSLMSPRTSPATR
jgi:hypothetical protein